MATLVAENNSPPIPDAGCIAGDSGQRSCASAFSSEYLDDFVSRLTRELKQVPEEDRREFAELLEHLSSTIGFLEKINPQESDEHKVTRTRLQAAYFHLLDRMEALCPRAKLVVEEEIEKSSISSLVEDIPLQR